MRYQNVVRFSWVEISFCLIMRYKNCELMYFFYQFYVGGFVVGVEEIEDGVEILVKFVMYVKFDMVVSCLGIREELLFRDFVYVRKMLWMW